MDILQGFIDFLNRWLAYPVDELPYVIIALLVAFTVHEYSHAFVAYKFGDPTAKRQGRLTLNPAVHLDPIGTLLILVAGFGWAKPVPVNYFFLRDKKYAGPLVSIAGPLSNLFIAIIGMGIWASLVKLGVFLEVSDKLGDALSSLFSILVDLNIILFIFNLLPLPPLDGYRVIEDLVPKEIRPKLIVWEQYGTFIFLIILVTPLRQYIFDPIFNYLDPYIYYHLQDFYSYLFNL